MKFSQCVVAFVAAAGVANTAPSVAKRYLRQTNIDDVNSALTLKHLKDKLYREGLANYTASQFESAGFNADFYKNLQIISEEESTHVTFYESFLTRAGAAPVAECTYRFPSTDPESFLELASVLESVVVATFIPFPSNLYDLRDFAESMSIEATNTKHGAYFREAVKKDPLPYPSKYVLTFKLAYALISQYIVECPKMNTPLPFEPFPTLKLDTTQSQPVKAGDTIGVLTEGYILQPTNSSVPLKAAFITSHYIALFAETHAFEGGFMVEVPHDADVNGQSYVVITNRDYEDGVTRRDYNFLAGPVAIEVTK
ncbi:MAG: hypothetical protein M1812_005152 [Candelaria pacifica]|nr:MAG: hypothetical protein M1812_005152 [Candelaria pacifica]